jgi:hypothetical protein
VQRCVRKSHIPHQLIKRPDLNAEKLARLGVLMNQSIPDSLVTGFEYLIPTLELPDLADRHVLAAAIVAEAKTIVTFNLNAANAAGVDLN